jgi:integrase
MDHATEMSVQRYLHDWLEHVRTRVRTRTYEGYEGVLRRYVLDRLPTVDLTELKPLDLQHLYSDLLANSHPPLSAGTVLNTHLVLTQAFGQAVRWGLIPSNPASGAQPPRPRRAELVSVDEPLVTKLLAVVAGSSCEVPAALAIGTGLRRSEILGLRWSDIDGDLEVARIRRTLQPTREGLVFERPKTKHSERSVVLGAFVRPYLERQRDDQAHRRERLGDGWHDEGLVIDRGDGAPMHPDTLSSAWSRMIKRSGLPHVRFHDLRHAHATLLLVKGVHPKIVSERLGHSSIGITLDTYSHVLPSMQHEAAQAFDELLDAKT